MNVAFDFRAPPIGHLVGFCPNMLPRYILMLSLFTIQLLKSLFGMQILFVEPTQKAASLPLWHLFNTDRII